MIACSSTSSSPKPRSTLSKVTPMPMSSTFTKTYCLNTPWWWSTFTNRMGRRSLDSVQCAKSNESRRKHNLASANVALTTMWYMLTGSSTMVKWVRLCNVAVRLAYWLPCTRKGKPRRRQATWRLSLVCWWWPLRASTSLKRLQAIGKT